MLWYYAVATDKRTIIGRYSSRINPSRTCIYHYCIIACAPCTYGALDVTISCTIFTGGAPWCFSDAMLIRGSSLSRLQG